MIDEKVAHSVLRSIDVAPTGMAVWQRPPDADIDADADADVADAGDLRLLYINRAGAEPSGRLPQDLIGSSMRSALPELVSSELADALMRTLQDGTERETTIMVPSGGGPLRTFRNVVHRVDSATVVATFIDNTREQRLEREYRVERRTGLATRALFDEVLAELVEAHDTTGAPIGLLFIDLDKFKRVNDQFSHVCGDELITHIAQRLRTIEPQPRLIARWGGDEFAILTEWDEPENLRLAEQILDSFAQQFLWQGNSIEVRSSIGAVTVRGTGFPGRRVLLEVDQAMYEAKDAGGNRIASQVLGERELVQSKA